MANVILNKIKNLYKKPERKLLEKYDIVDPESSLGVDDNGFILETLTELGNELLTRIAWTKHRSEVVEILKKMDEEKKKAKKEKDEDDEGEK